MSVSEIDIVAGLDPAIHQLRTSSTVVSMDPAGKAGPLYTGREIFSQGEARWRKVQRFVPDNELHW